MVSLSIRQLADIATGSLTLGAMPPLAGNAEPVGRIVVDTRAVRSGDVYWALVGDDGAWMCEEAYSKGALGVIVQGRRIEPWAGRFCLEVADATAALARVVRCLTKNDAGQRLKIFGTDALTQAAIAAIAGNDEVQIKLVLADLARQAEPAPAA